MDIQTWIAQYAEELWELLKTDNTYVYMCGLKGMEKGIDDIMVSLVAKDGNLRVRLVHCNGYYTVIRISITRNKRSCNVITIIIYLFGDNTWIEP